MQILQLIDEVFQKNPKIVEDAKTMKSAEYYLAGLIIDELMETNKTVNDTVFNMVKKKLEAHKKLNNSSKK